MDMSIEARFAFLVALLLFSLQKKTFASNTAATPFNGSWISMGTETLNHGLLRSPLPTSTFVYYANGTLPAKPLGIIFENRTSEEICNKLSGLSAGQRQLCHLYTDHMTSIASGAKLGITECQHQFHDRRWNCTRFDDTAVFGPVMKLATKETAFAHAITTASVAYMVARACREGSLSSCGCSRAPRPRNLFKDWIWGGCGDNLEYGYKFTQGFIDVKEKEKKFRPGTKKQGRSLMNLHNNEAGRRAIIKKSRVTCKCHGVSGSCSLITCWQQLPSFREIGDYLLDKYDGATEVRLNRRGRLQIRDPRYTMPTANDLVYINESPNYCLRDLKVGSFGTSGRNCNRTSLGTDGCNLMCCGRGYNTKKLTVRERCDCKFKWCCEVECKTCIKSTEVYTCK